MEQAVLTSAQKKAIAAVGAESNLADFYLSGGTALAVYYLNHRFSDDLDFFCFEEPNKIFLRAFAEILKEKLGAKSVRFERLYDRNQFFFSLEREELKVEFARYPFHQLEKPTMKDNIRIDSFRDIAANKLMTLLDRFDPKDFADMFFILQEYDLTKVRQDAEKKFGAAIGDIFIGSELAKARRIEALPKMIKNLTVNELKEFFAQQAKMFDKNIFE